jgi:hypothetical protein
LSTADRTTGLVVDVVDVVFGTVRMFQVEPIAAGYVKDSLLEDIGSD